MKIDRASTNDLVMLATDSGGQVPNSVGAVLLLSGGSDQGGGDQGGPHSDIDDTLRVISSRICRIPRLRQRLVRVPFGCGRPVWVDDPHFDVSQHLRHLSCPAPGDEDALLSLAATTCVAALPSSRPRWAAVLVSGLADGKVALILVLHHVLADGIGGLAVLAGLVDDRLLGDGLPGDGLLGDGSADRAPRPRPKVPELFADALRSRWQSVCQLPAALLTLRGSFRSAGGLHPPPAGDCSLFSRTGPNRQIAVARTDLATMHAAAAAEGATVNDALLAAVTAALHQLLVHRGEALDTFRVTVPVAGSHPRSTTELGNDVSVLAVELPGAGEPAERLQQISAKVRAARAVSSGPSPAALVGPLFRVIAAMGGYRRYLRGQRRFHTIVSNVRGPGGLVTLAGSSVESIIPLAVEDLGNVTVIFLALSYAGTLTVSAVADPDHLPDLPVLIDALQTELDGRSTPREHLSVAAI